MKKTNRTPATYIVVVRCNLDDVIVAAWPDKRTAIAQMKRLAKAPDPTRAEAHKSDRWDDSGLIAVAVYRAQGNKVEGIDQVDIEEQREAA